MGLEEEEQGQSAGILQGQGTLPREMAELVYLVLFQVHLLVMQEEEAAAEMLAEAVLHMAVVLELSGVVVKLEVQEQQTRVEAEVVELEALVTEEMEVLE